MKNYWLDRIREKEELKRKSKITKDILEDLKKEELKTGKRLSDSDLKKFYKYQFRKRFKV